MYHKFGSGRDIGLNSVLDVAVFVNKFRSFRKPPNINPYNKAADVVFLRPPEKLSYAIESNSLKEKIIKAFHESWPSMSLIEYMSKLVDKQRVPGMEIVLHYQKPFISVPLCFEERSE